MEGSPDGIDYDKVRMSLRRVKGVKSVHDLHIWSISEDKHCLTVHLELKEEAKIEKLEESKRGQASQIKITKVGDGAFMAD